MKISIVVPIFNEQTLLQRCVESIVNQTYRNLEIILVDDGSTDNSLSIAREYLSDSRVSVFHKPNGGLSSTRNYGIERVTGDFIGFVDSDDWIELDIIEHCVKIIEKYQSDIVDFRSIFKNTDTEETPVPEEYTYEVIEKDKLKYDYLYKGQTQKMPFSVCRKLYKRDLFDAIRFIEGMKNEDIVINFELMAVGNKLVHTNKIGYNYFQSEGSMTRGGLKESDFDLLKACQYLTEMSQNDPEDVKYLVKVKYARSYFSLLAKIAFYGFADENLDQKKVVNDLTKRLRENYGLLMQSPMPLNRKLMVTALSLDMRFLQLPLKAYKALKR
ncbi:glycosyltransferase family 2 protein [Jeotgalibaca sp. A122]|uniref:glycosyltransferase family 2 protein n=1 Tax=Jeotgalibaca sp. A122 TaxID=3457322 RepID=UPI003FD23D73